MAAASCGPGCLICPLLPAGSNHCRGELELPEDGVLRIKPLQELKSLRYDGKQEEGIIVKSDTAHRLKEISGNAIELDVAFISKPPVLHGQNGFSKKGPGEGQASYYASFTDLETHGFLRIQPGSSRTPVRGKSWFDHEFASNQLSPKQQGWDWFSLHLPDGRDLMIYMLRRKDGSVEPA